jgi:predicted nucleotidyltransferase
MRSMAADLSESIAAAAAALKAAGAREVYLFGSAAERSLHENSDVDMAVSGLPQEVSFRAMGAAPDPLERLGPHRLGFGQSVYTLPQEERGVTACGIIRARAKR